MCLSNVNHTLLCVAHTLLLCRTRTTGWRVEEFAFVRDYLSCIKLAGHGDNFTKYVKNICLSKLPDSYFVYPKNWHCVTHLQSCSFYSFLSLLAPYEIFFTFCLHAQNKHGSGILVMGCQGYVSHLNSLRTPYTNLSAPFPSWCNSTGFHFSQLLLLLSKCQKRSFWKHLGLLLTIHMLNTQLSSCSSLFIPKAPLEKRVVDLHWFQIRSALTFQNKHFWLQAKTLFCCIKENLSFKNELSIVWLGELNNNLQHLLWLLL